MSKFIESEDSDVAIAVAPEEGPTLDQFDGVEEDAPKLTTGLPWWKTFSYNPMDWYRGAVKEAKDFTWEITEPNHVVSLIFLYKKMF